MGGLNTLDRDSLLRQVSRLDQRIKVLERLLQGQPITSVRIADLSANKISTGILAIKDGTDGAKIVVYDAMDNEIVTIDSSGITVEGGNILVRNENGDVVFDTAGLVSETNFTSDSVFSDVFDSTTSTSSIQLDDMSLTTPDMGRETKALILFTTQYAMSASGAFQAQTAMGVRINGVADNDAVIYGLWDEKINNNARTETLHLITNLPAGANTITINWITAQLGGATATANNYRRNLSYLILGT